MSKTRQIAILFVCTAMLAACNGGVLATLPASYTADTRDEPYLDFLPIEAILSADPVDLNPSLARVNALRARADDLRNRARILRRPVVEAQEKLRLQQAIARSNS